MKFVYHPAYDFELPSKVCSLADAAKPQAEIGIVYGGNLALLRVLELHLGIAADDSSSFDRCLQFLNLLEDRCKKEKTFYAESLQVDPIGTARTLLDWRDQLVFAHWTGTADGASSARLKEMSALHALALKITLGEADRFLAVWALLHDRSLDFLRIESKLSLQTVRGLLGRILEKLKAQDKSLSSERTNAKVGSDLYKLQLYLNSRDTSPATDLSPEFKNDGSLILIEGISDTLLSRYCISGISKWNEAKNLSYAVLAGEAQDVFNIAASANGLPRIMPGDGDGLRGNGAFLHLLIEMAWNPYDVNLWLRFLNLSPNPLPEKLRERLSQALGEAPGIGSDTWFGAIALYCEDQMRAGLTHGTKEQIDSSVRLWLNSSTWMRKAGATKDQVCALFERVVAWSDSEISKEESHYFTALKQDAQGFLLVLNVWFLKRDRLDEKSLAALFKGSLGRGRNPSLDAQATAIHCAQHPAAVLGTVDRLLIWNLSDRQKVVTLPWTIAEQKSLEAQGCELTMPFDSVDEKTSSLKNLILLTKDRLTIAFCNQILAKTAGLHPLLREVTELPSIGALLTNVDAMLVPHASVSLEKRNHAIALPFAQSHWKISPALFNPRHYESASSIEKIILQPHGYVLNYVAKLREPAWHFSLEANNIKGKLVHKLFELFVESLKKGEKFDQTKSLKSWIDSHFEVLVPERAFMLQVESEKIHFEQLKTEIESGLQKFYAEIHRVPAVNIHSEYPIDTNKGRWMGRQIWTEVTGEALKLNGICPHLRGSVDLCWTDEKGNTKILDIKWSSNIGKFKKMLQENKQIQIAIYSALLKDGVWPAAGYLTLPNATIRTLAHDEKSFLQPQFTPDEINGDHPSSRLWSDVQSLWMWRWAQLHEGYIEITTEKVDEDNQLAVFKVPEGLSFELKGGVPEYNYGKILTGTGRKAG